MYVTYKNHKCWAAFSMMSLYRPTFSQQLLVWLTSSIPACFASYLCIFKRERLRKSDYYFNIWSVVHTSKEEICGWTSQRGGHFVLLKRKCSWVWKLSGESVTTQTRCSLLGNHFYNTMNSKLSDSSRISLSWFFLSSSSLLHALYTSTLSLLFLL